MVIAFLFCYHKRFIVGVEIDGPLSLTGLTYTAISTEKILRLRPDRSVHVLTVETKIRVFLRDQFNQGLSSCPSI